MLGVSYKSLLCDNFCAHCRQNTRPSFSVPSCSQKIESECEQLNTDLRVLRANEQRTEVNFSEMCDVAKYLHTPYFISTNNTKNMPLLKYPSNPLEDFVNRSGVCEPHVWNHLSRRLVEVLGGVVSPLQDLYYTEEHNTKEFGHIFTVLAAGYDKACPICNCTSFTIVFNIWRTAESEYRFELLDYYSCLLWNGCLCFH